MGLSEEKISTYIKRLLLSRMRILSNHGFYGLLLMHMNYSIDENMDTAGTDGIKIMFAPKFLESLSDDELDFVMMHEILHVVLQHCMREETLDHNIYNIAADIVVNSNILLENNMNLKSISLKNNGPSIHLAPDGVEGYEYTAEQVYSMLYRISNKKSWDNHSNWGSCVDNDMLRDLWNKYFEDACKAIEIRDPSNTRGLLPMFAKRALKELKKSQVDWKAILNDFIQEEVSDYSFSPPDRRYDDIPFFLPDFNEKEDFVQDILFGIVNICAVFKPTKLCSFS